VREIRDMYFASKLYRLLMWGFWQRNVRFGSTRPDGSSEDFYGFGADAVECMHYHRIGADDEGVWFRLHDGRVFDWRGDRWRSVDPLHDLTI